MSKAKLYRIYKKNDTNKLNKSDSFKFIISVITYALVLMIASFLFSGIYIKNFFYALVAALILSFLNSTLKPILISLTMPLTIKTLGIMYPLTNMIILKLCSLLMGKAFTLKGFISLFFISIFISILKIILDNIITNKIERR